MRRRIPVTTSELRGSSLEKQLDGQRHNEIRVQLDGKFVPVRAADDDRIPGVLAHMHRVAQRVLDDLRGLGIHVLGTDCKVRAPFSVAARG